MALASCTPVGRLSAAPDNASPKTFALVVVRLVVPVVSRKNLRTILQIICGVVFCGVRRHVLILPSLVPESMVLSYYALRTGQSPTLNRGVDVRSHFPPPTCLVSGVVFRVTIAAPAPASPARILCVCTFDFIEMPLYLWYEKS